ncbi:HNH endonuclease signature motif containing protein [Neobacillus sp. NPDC093127]|uniref:HNH endonuclease signature motif containing protein n=1 Tax=Neobacillus sp. NPDC093127 TaxID=3364296 RepID=UPI0038264F31
MKWTEQEIKFLQDYYELKGCKFCSEALEKTESAIRHKASKLVILRRGSARGVRVIDHKEGYLAVSSYGERIELHRLVMEYTLGRKLRPHEIVHHIDGDKWNNHPDNLELVNRSEHMKIHDASRPRNEKGQFTS